MKRLIYSFLLLSFPAFLFAQESEKLKAKALVEYVEALKSNSDLRNASWSIRVVNLADSTEVVSFDDQRSLMPASNQKVITTGTGLMILGDDFRFETKIGYCGTVTADSILKGDIYIIGGGDPSLGSAAYSYTVPDSIFARWSDAVKAAGIRRVEGKVIADRGRVFDDEYRRDSWNWGDIGLGYGAGTSGLQFADNRLRLNVRAGATVGSAAYVSIIRPDVPDIYIDSDIRTVSKNKASNITIIGSPNSNRIIIKGEMPIDRGARAVDAAIPNTALACAWGFDSYLNQKGISTHRTVEIRPLPPKSDFRLITTSLSPTLAELLIEINKRSNNSYAESVLKMVGYVKSGEGSTDEGVSAVAKYLKEQGLDLSGVNQADGSGLSRKNMVTTCFMCDFLIMMHGNSTFKSSLPIGGVDGTLATILKKGAAYDNIQAKSGSLESVRGHSGYVTTKGGQKMCFSILINNYTCRASIISGHLEKMMQLMAEIE